MARQNHAKNHQHKPSPQTVETLKSSQSGSAKPEVNVARPEVSAARPEPVSAQPEPVPAARPAPSYEQISQRAYELYLSRGGDHGRHEEDWTQAERELSLNH